VSFLADVDPALTAKLDQRYATVNGHLSAIIERAAVARDESPEGTYAKLIMAIPDGVKDQIARDWLCVALTRLVQVELGKKKVNHSEEGTV